MEGRGEQAFHKQGMLRMDVYRCGARFFTRAPAKLNLFFEVLAKRADGFHEIETLMVPIGLYDSLSLQATSRSASSIDDSVRREPAAPSGQDSADIRVTCRWASPGFASAFGPLPSSEENLVTRALLLLQRRSNTNRGARAELIKRIPTAAGLGGGSSDAAAALCLANAAWGLDWPLLQLADLAAELGSDVPFFLEPEPAICRGRGEIIERIRRLPTLHYVVVRPPEGLSTPAVYQACRPAGMPHSPGPLLAALRSGDLRELSRGLFNRLQSAAASLTPWIERLEREFAALGCRAAQMSGSGSSFFGIFHHARQARQAAAILRARGMGQVFAVGG